jgi:hypothetical protein
MPHPSTVELVENASDSLRHGVAQYLVRDEAPTAIKHAILNIYHSIELFLKARISQAHPLLIYRTLDKLVTPDSQTIGLSEIVIRLQNLAMPLDAAHVTSLGKLQKRRNRIEHYAFQPSPDHDSAVGQALKFLLEFLPVLGVTLESLIEESADYQQLLHAILSYEELVARASAEAKMAGGRVIRCPHCDEMAATVDSGEGDCHFCHEHLQFQQCERCGAEVPEAELDDLGLCETCLEHVLGA